MLLNKKFLILLLMITIVAAGVLFVDTASADASVSWGSRGSEVVKVQNALNARGYWCGTADGIFGAKTYNAVVRFQKDHGISAIGVVGPQTSKALGVTQTVSQTQPSRSGQGRILTMVASAYTADPKENYPWGGYPSYIGLPLDRGIVAVDPRVIPMGTRLYIEGYGPGIAADQGNAIKGNRIDLFMHSKSEALAWGLRTVKVTIL